jgi:thioredoxin
MNRTKAVFFLLFASFIVFSSCKDGSKTDSQTNNGNGTIHMTKSDFVSKVFDFEKEQTWKYRGDVPCIIDFYADWCRPCKMVGPIMEELAGQYKGKIRIYKVNVDEEPELAKAFNINSIPAVFFVPMKGEPRMNVGAMAKPEYEKVINEFLIPSI